MYHIDRIFAHPPNMMGCKELRPFGRILAMKTVICIAAAMAALKGVHPRDLDVKALRKALAEAGAYLG